MARASTTAKSPTTAVPWPPGRPWAPTPPTGPAQGQYHRPDLGGQNHQRLARPVQHLHLVQQQPRHQRHLCRLPGSNTCNATLPGNLDTEAYVTAVNAAALCTYTDWRMPTQRELLTLAHDAGRVNPSIDPTYFPNTPASNFWAGSSYPALPSFAWHIDFNKALPKATISRSTTTCGWFVADSFRPF